MSFCGAGNSRPSDPDVRTGGERVDGRRPPDVCFVFGSDLTAPRRARDALQGLLGDPCDPIVWEVTLAVSELITNVVIHTGAGGEMRVWRSKPDRPVRLEVHDGDARSPTRRHGPSLGGRGLRIVESVADDWGVTLTPSGKFVWAEFNRSED